jgi:hypothetical protein
LYLGLEATSNLQQTAIHDTFWVYAHTCLIVPLSIVGIVCNVVSVFILREDQSIRHTTRFLLQSLAITDAVCLALRIILVYLLHTVYSLGYLPSGNLIMNIVKYSLPLWHIAFVASVWLMVVTAADRYVIACQPLFAVTLSTMSRTRAAVCVLWLASALFNSPRFFELRVLENEHASTLDSTELRDSSNYVVVYRICLHLVVTCLLPFLLLVFFRQHLRRYLRNPPANIQLDEAAVGERRCTSMLIAVITVYLVCQLPYHSCDVYLLSYAYRSVTEHIDENTMYFHHVAHLYVIAFSNFLNVITSSVKFVVYVTTNKTFRRTLINTLMCRCWLNKLQGGARHHLPEVGFQEQDASVTSHETSAF